MGVVGIETAFPLLYTHLVKPGRLPLERLIDALTAVPRRRFRLGGGLQVGDRAEVCAFDLNAEGTVNPSEFLSMGHATPFEGWPMEAACRFTLCGETIAYNTLEGGC